MTTTTMTRGSNPFADAAIVTKRTLLRITRNPQLVLFSTVQPIMFLVLFNYVFGGALSFGGPIAEAGDYINWLIPGILIQSAVFGAQGTALGLNEDLNAGVIDRFRSLPMSRSAVLAGRTIADLARMSFVLGLMLLVGWAMGWSPTTGGGEVLLGFLLALGYAFALSWVMANLGLSVKDAETAQVVAFLPLFPFVFASSVFVPTETMPDWLAAFAENQPITILTNAIRGLTLGGATSTDIFASIAWIVGITVVAAPLAVRIYRRSTG